MSWYSLPLEKDEGVTTATVNLDFAKMNYITNGYSSIGSYILQNRICYCSTDT
ncbi:MAG: hypothetical protein ACTSUO_01575 [Candidatus Thorarchaeota archaeon]